MNHVVLLSGLGSSLPFLSWFFQAWARKLAKRLGPLPGTTVWQLSSDGAGEKPATVAILRDFERGRLGRVVLVGHSNGARDILFMAQAFYNAGISVRYAATLDMTLNELGVLAYPNIQYLDEFHARLEKVDFHPDFRRTGANYHYWEIDSGHVAMASTEEVQQRLATKIVEALRA